jgi:hypothetical protein
LRARSILAVTHSVGEHQVRVENVPLEWVDVTSANGVVEDLHELLVGKHSETID